MVRIGRIRWGDCCQTKLYRFIAFIRPHFGGIRLGAVEFVQLGEQHLQSKADLYIPNTGWLVLAPSRHIDSQVQLVEPLPHLIKTTCLYVQ